MTIQRRQRVRKMGNSKAMWVRMEKWADGIAKKERVEKLEKRVAYLEGVAKKNGIKA